MKRFKSIFLVLVIMLLSLGLASNTYARERNGSSRDRDLDYGSRGYRSRRDNSGGWGSKGGLAGGYIGGKIGSRAGDAWERRANRGAHDKWNNKGRKDRGYGGGWRFSDEID